MLELLNRSSIKKRLAYALTIWIIAFACSGIFTIVQMGNLEKVTEKIYMDPLKVSNSAIEARVYLNKIQQEIKALALVDSKEDAYSHIERIESFEKGVINNLDNINHFATLEANLILEEEIRNVFEGWRRDYSNIITLVLDGNYIEAQANIENQDREIINTLELRLIEIDRNAKENAANLSRNAKNIEKGIKTTLLIYIVILVGFFLLAFILIIRSILQPINIIKAAMDESIATGELNEVQLQGNNEITDISKCYNMLILKLKNQFWINNNENLLNKVISSASTFSELTQETLNTLSRLLEVGKGALYLYDYEDKTLNLNASFAFTKDEETSRVYALGEGIVGQVALEKKPIFLKNINLQDSYIQTGLIKEVPLNIYSFPLIHEEELYGVIELASFNEFDNLKQEFLTHAAEIISINLHSSIQNEKVKILLQISEKAQKEARDIASQLQQTNAELEEQQQLLEKQSEELHQTNAQLEEQQQLLEEQSRLLNIKNQQLEVSKEELVENSKKLQEASKYKSEFLANMSHELRTPLNSIILLSRLLMKDDKNTLTKDDFEKVGVIHNSGQELLRLINDILDLSKIEAGKSDLNPIEFNTWDLVTEAKQLFEGLAKESNIDFNVEDSVNARVFCDRDKISQILRNFISNAIKFTERGSVTLKVMAHEENKNGITFSVMDTGIGISDENIDRVFEEFQQVDGTISRKFGGTGLGLSISKKLAKLLKGQISVKSKMGEGSTFALHLKDILVPSEAKNLSIESNEDMEEVAITSDSLPINLTREKAVLVIEDDEHFAHYIKSINEKMGFDTIVARTGNEGLQYSKKYPIDAILLDLMLPDISGIDILRELKSTTELRNIPVHIISAMDKNNLPQRLGAVGYQQKPMEEKDVSSVISKTIKFSNKETKQLLVVVKDKDKTLSINSLIDDKSVEVKTVDSEEKAKIELDKGIYDAIVLVLQIGSRANISIYNYLKEKSLEIPIIVYSADGLTLDQEKSIRKYSDSIIIKTAHSHEMLLDEITLFLHNVKKKEKNNQYLRNKTNKEYALRLEGKTILIVDDDPRNIFILASALEDFGADILEAENGQIAISQLQNNTVDLILIDIMMPIMDGYETMKAIRKNENLKDIPIIAITAKSLKEDREKCIAAGANDYISKPVDYDTLLRLVKAWTRN